MNHLSPMASVTAEQMTSGLSLSKTCYVDPTPATGSWSSKQDGDLVLIFPFPLHLRLCQKISCKTLLGVRLI